MSSGEVKATRAAASSISLSISSSTGSASNDGNLTLTTPQGGGIATGSQTLDITTNASSGWTVTMAMPNGTSLINAKDNTKIIPTLPSTATIDQATALSNNTCGVAFPYGSWQTNNYFSPEANYQSTDQTILKSTKWASLTAAINPSQGSIASSDNATGPSHDGTAADTRTIYYGARVDNPKALQSGNYTATVVYTATAQLPPTPIITSVEPAAIITGTATDVPKYSRGIYMVGANFSESDQIFVDFNGDGQRASDASEDCTDIDGYSENPVALACAAPAHTTAGQFAIYVVSPDGVVTVKEKAITYKPALWKKADTAKVGDWYDYGGNGGSDCRNADANSQCQVDIDANMIPITYGGVIRPDKTSKWANAITVKPDKLAKYKNAAAGTDVLESDIVGYWVYVPRYAYEVMRRDAADKPVDAQIFDIRFEKASTTKKIPGSCVGGSSASKDYRTQCGLSRTYGSATGTTWATHPAFTFGDRELNGIWVAKYAASSDSDATNILIKPGLDGNPFDVPTIGSLYDAAKAMGVRDASNTYGNSSSLAYNSHNLARANTRIIKNSEWGAVAYLSDSKYGTGLEIYSNDNAYAADSYTGCGNGVAAIGIGYNDARSACIAYSSTIGQLSSTTGNTYGVYDMNTTDIDLYVMAGYTTVPGQSSSNYITTPVRPPYINLYQSDVFTDGDSWKNIGQECTWETCGGQALYETTTALAIWEGGNYPEFPAAKPEDEYSDPVPWVGRGEDYYGDEGIWTQDRADGQYAGIDATSNFRAVLVTR